MNMSSNVKRVCANSALVVLLLGILITPVASVALMKLKAPSTQVLSSQSMYEEIVEAPESTESSVTIPSYLMVEGK